MKLDFSFYRVKLEVGLNHSHMYYLPDWELHNTALNEEFLP
jgi:hypothetical protein